MAIHTFAAIYIGTYDVSLKVFEFTNRKKFHEVDHIRSRQELGKGTYGTGTIGYEQVEELCETLAQFKEIMESYKVDSYEVCAAAALRDTTNEIFVLDQIYLRTGFRVKVLSNSEHRFISYKAVAGSPVFEEMIKTSAAVVDVGGASVQITLFRDGKMITTQHMETGIMRLRNLLGDRGYSLKMYENQIEEYVNKKLEGFRAMYMNAPVDYLILISDYAGGLVKKIEEKGGKSRQVKLDKFSKFIDKLLCVTPYYNKATQGGLIRYYTEIANSVKLPIIMYNVPSRTGCNILPETAAKLYHDVENIVAIKEATGNVAQAAKTMYLTDGKLDLYSGEDGIVVPLMSIGAIGVISVWSNVAPKDVHDMCMAFFDGDTKKAMEIQLKAQPLIEALFSEVNPIPVKKALNLMGMEAGPLRSPLTEMTDANAAKLAEAMKNYGIKLA